MKLLKNLKFLKLLIFFIAHSICPSLSAQTQQLYYYIPERIGAYGPIFGEDKTNDARVTSLMFVPPLTTDEKYEIALLLFQSKPKAAFLPDGRVRYSFDLKQNIYWHDGEKLTADDIVFTYKVIKNENVECPNPKEKVDNIVNMKANGKYKLDVYFNQKNEDILGALTFNILPEHLFQDIDREDPYFLKPSESFFTQDPIGCGMYVKDEIIEGFYTSLRRNEGYNLTDKPNIDKIKIRLKENISNIIDEFLGKPEVNFLPDVPISNMERIIASPTLDIISYKEFSWDFVAFNLRKPVFKDIDLRKAINLCVDKYAMNANIFKGEAQLLTGPFPPNSPAYNLGYRPEPPNLDKAKKILMEHGCFDTDNDGYLEKDGIPLRFNITYFKKSLEDDHIVTSLMSFMGEIGIYIDAEPLDYNNFEKRVYIDHDFDMALISFKFGTDPDIYTIFKSTEDKPMGNNVCGFAFPDVDELLDEARRRASREARMQIYKQLHEMIAQKYPGIFLWQKPKFIAFDKNIKGINQATVDPINIFKYIYKW